MSKNQHVIPSGGKWAVRRAGSSRASGIFVSRNEAVDAARGIARNQGTSIYIHDVDGRILSREQPSRRSDESK